MERITREQMFMEVAITASKRSLCKRKKVGAVLIRDNRIIAIGYNGTLPGVPASVGINEDGSSNTIHAETNLIAFCAKQGITTKGCDLYITLSPCVKCSEIILQAGIKKVIYLEEYRNKEGILLINDRPAKYNNSCHQFIE